MDNKYLLDSPYWSTALDCGHLPEAPKYFHGTGVPLTTGAAIDRETGASMCYACASLPDIEAVANRKAVSAYVSSDGKSITTWPGVVLMRITYNGTARTGFNGSTIRYIRAVSPNGQRYYGKNGGNGSYINMKPSKAKG